MIEFTIKKLSIVLQIQRLSMVNSTRYLKKLTNFLILHKFFLEIEEKLYDHFNICKQSIMTKFTKNIREIP